MKPMDFSPGNARTTSPPKRCHPASHSPPRFRPICHSMKHLLLNLMAPALAVATLLGAPAAQANEQIFAYSYLAETLPAGVWEVENLTTYRTKKSQGTYRLLQNRTELEYGVTDRWMVSMYVNSYSVTARDNNSIASRNSPGGGPTTLGSYVADADTLPFPSARYTKRDFESVSLESIY